MNLQTLQSQVALGAKTAVVDLKADVNNVDLLVSEMAALPIAKAVPLIGVADNGELVGLVPAEVARQSIS